LARRAGVVRHRGRRDRGRQVRRTRGTGSVLPGFLRLPHAAGAVGPVRDRRRAAHRGTAVLHRRGHRTARALDPVADPRRQPVRAVRCARRGDGHRGLERCRMRRAALCALLLAWLYGVPFLLIVGLIRRTSSPHLATRAEAQAFGATTDAVLIAALALNLAVPLSGVLLARLAREPYWTRHFAWSLAGTVLICLAVSAADAAATAPLIGYTPADQEPVPPVDHCVPISGGRGCPGG